MATIPQSTQNQWIDITTPEPISNSISICDDSPEVLLYSDSHYNDILKIKTSTGLYLSNDSGLNWNNILPDNLPEFFPNTTNYFINFSAIGYDFYTRVYKIFIIITYYYLGLKGKIQLATVYINYGTCNDLTNKGKWTWDNANKDEDININYNVFGSISGDGNILYTATNKPIFFGLQKIITYYNISKPTIEVISYNEDIGIYKDLYYGGISCSNDGTYVCYYTDGKIFSPNIIFLNTIINILEPDPEKKLNISTSNYPINAIAISNRSLPDNTPKISYCIDIVSPIFYSTDIGETFSSIGDFSQQFNSLTISSNGTKICTSTSDSIYTGILNDSYNDITFTQQNGYSNISGFNYLVLVI